MPYMFVFPMDPSNTVSGHMYGDEYGIWPTKYIGGIDADVLLSKTLKCKFRIQNILDNLAHLNLINQLIG